MTARSDEERYRSAQTLMRQAIEMAHARGIQVAIGFGFGVHPPELASIVPPESRIPGAMLPDPTHPANIEILHATLDDLLTAHPGLDWVWLWLHEHSMFVAPETEMAVGCTGRLAVARRARGRPAGRVPAELGGERPQKPDDEIVGCVRDLTAKGGVITWDVPIRKSGLIPEPFLGQLRAIGRARAKSSG